jgi:hypothetical protein
MRYGKCKGTPVLALAVMIIAASDGSAQGTGLSFVRTKEPNEGAFTILVPRGWKSEGGIFRVNAVQAGGPINAMEAKCNLVFKSDDRGTVAFHILPDMVYVHVGVGGGLIAPGSNYQGATVRPLEDAPRHLSSLFAALHPQVKNPKIIKITRLPGEIQSMQQGMAYLNQTLAQLGGAQMTFQSDAAGAIFEYTEGGVQFREVMLTGIVDMRAALTWKNTRSLSFRAPVSEFERWRPVMDIMRFSVKFNPEWILKEAQGQRERADIVRKVYDEIRRIDQEMLRKSAINRSEIMNDNYLVLTGQEEYTNPHTGETEVDTDAYKYRWETPGGDIYYSNTENENPNTFMQRGDYQRTPVRKRRNE